MNRARRMLPSAAASLVFTAIALAPQTAWAQSCFPFPAGMEAWWPFDETSGSTAAELILKADGALVGGATHQPGMVAGGVRLTSSSQFMTVPSAPDHNFGVGSFSIDAWVRTLDAATSVRTILDKRESGPIGYALVISFGRLVLQLADASGFTNFTQVAPGNLTDGAWHHVAATVDRESDVGKLYVDGQVVHTFTPSTRPGSVTNSGDLRIGQAFNGSSINFNGDIDEVDLLRRALEASEVEAIYQAGSDGKCKPIVPDNPTEVRIETTFDSGSLDNNGDLPAIVFTQDVHTPDAAWSRAYFSAVELAPGSILRVTSLLDNAVQELDRFTAEIWGLGSAYFNGDTIRIQIVAAPHTTGNRVALDGIGAQLDTTLPICGDLHCACSPDGRVFSNEDWSGRWYQGGCSASVYNEHGCYVSAGHCSTPVPGTVLIFRAPLSNTDCTMRQPPPADQFPVLSTLADRHTCSPDWRVGRLGVNSLGQTHYQRYGVFRPLASAAPTIGQPVDLYGFGVSDFPLFNGIQQRTTETLTAFDDIFVDYIGGTITPGTSGCGVSQNGAIIGINNCCNGPCKGFGSPISLPAFVAARQQLCPHRVHAPSSQAFCAIDAEVIAPITVCNTTAGNDSYGLSFTSVAPGPNCSVAGPTSFQVIGGTPIPIPRGQCHTAKVKIGRPSGFIMTGNTACYDVTATSQSTAVAETVRGSVQMRFDICTVSTGGGSNPQLLRVGVPRQISFTIRNDAVPSGLIDYRVEALGPDLEASPAMALNGQYVGVPVDGVAFIPLGSTGQISVLVNYRWLQPFDVSNIVVSTDINGDEVLEPLTSIGVRSTSPPGVPSISSWGLAGLGLALMAVACSPLVARRLMPRSQRGR